MPTPTAWGSPMILIAIGVPLAAAVVFLVLWLVALRRAGRLRAEIGRHDVSLSNLALSVAEQGGRLRIIRELLDLAVHRVSTIVAQAEGAKYAGGSDASAVLRAADTIADTGRSTLADMRRVTTLVRDTEAETGPQPALESIRDLFKVMRNAGLRVQFQETGNAYNLNTGAELAIYRILQEALTNSLKYGGEGTEAWVALTWSGQGLAVRVDDDGLRNSVHRRGLPTEQEKDELGYTVEDDLRSLTQEVNGAGLAEMRARAELYGGSLTANEVPGVGFSISAAFPSIRFHNGVHGVDLGRP